MNPNLPNNGSKPPQNQPTQKHPIPNTNFVPIQMAGSENKGKKNSSVPRSTLIIFWIFVGYFVLTIIGAAYFLTITKVKIFNLNSLASISSNLTPKASIDLPMCIPRTNRTALRSSILENEYGGRVKSFETDISSKSADFHSTITLEKGFGNLFTYFIDKDDINRVTFYNGSEIKNRSIEGLKIGDSVIIHETLNLRRPPDQAKTKIEVEVL